VTGETLEQMRKSVGEHDVRIAEMMHAANIRKHVAALKAGLRPHVIDPVMVDGRLMYVLPARPPTRSALDYEHNEAEMFWSGSQWPKAGMHMTIPDAIARRCEKAMYADSVVPPIRLGMNNDAFLSSYLDEHKAHHWTLERVRRTAGR